MCERDNNICSVLEWVKSNKKRKQPRIIHDKCTKDKRLKLGHKLKRKYMINVHTKQGQKRKINSRRCVLCVCSMSICVCARMCVLCVDFVWCWDVVRVVGRWIWWLWVHCQNLNAIVYMCGCCCSLDASLRASRSLVAHTAKNQSIAYSDYHRHQFLYHLSHRNHFHSLSSHLQCSSSSQSYRVAVGCEHWGLLQMLLPVPQWGGCYWPYAADVAGYDDASDADRCYCCHRHCRPDCRRRCPVWYRLADPMDRIHVHHNWHRRTSWTIAGTRNCLGNVP